MVGLARLVHPFPSALDAVVTLGLALLARAPADRAAVLAVAMLGIQFSIEALNVLLDSPTDKIARRAKPLVEGKIPVRAAGAVVAVTGATGLVLALLAGPFAALVAAAGYAIGIAYDLRLKASPWSWLPFAAGDSAAPHLRLGRGDRKPSRTDPVAGRAGRPRRDRPGRRERAGRRGARRGERYGHDRDDARTL